MICRKITIHTKDSEDYASLDTYILEKFLDEETVWKRPLVLICPGGAYRKTSRREAEPVAIQLNSMGYHAAVLHYSCSPAVYPTALHEVALAVKLVREHAEAWNVNPEKILVMGFSAGGHLAASYSVFWREAHMAEAAGTKTENLKPNGLVLCYPVISSEESITHAESIHNLLGDSYETLKEKISLEYQVGDQVPPTFLWHTFTDTTVPFWNSFRFAEALGRIEVPLEFHLYPKGEHGLSLAEVSIAREDGSGVEESCQSWMPLLKGWLLRNFGL